MRFLSIFFNLKKAIDPFRRIQWISFNVLTTVSFFFLGELSVPVLSWIPTGHADQTASSPQSTQQVPDRQGPPSSVEKSQLNQPASGATTTSLGRSKSYPWRVAESDHEPAQANLYKEGTQNYAFQAVYLLKKLQLISPKGKSSTEVRSMIKRNGLEKFCDQKSNELQNDPKQCIKDYRATLAAQIKDVERKLQGNQAQIGELEDNQVSQFVSIPKQFQSDGNSRRRIVPIIEVDFGKNQKGESETKVRVPYIPTVGDLAKAQKGLSPFRQKRVQQWSSVLAAYL